MARRAAPPRRPDAGVTLVEILVVLVLIGVVVSAVTISLGAVTRGNALQHEADLLVARLNRAATEVLLTGEPMSFEWEHGQYRFGRWQDGAWQAHNLPILNAAHVLSGGVRFDRGLQGGGAFYVGPDMLPSTEEAVSIHLAAEGGRDINIIFDGITATRVAGAG